MNDFSNNLMKKTFYLTALFSDIKSSNNWTTNEIKTIISLFQQLSKYRVFLKDFNHLNSENDINNFYKMLKDVPLKFDITKADISYITGVPNAHLSREINKIRKSLIGKVMHTPHPFEKLDVNSGSSFSWFQNIVYSNKEGILSIYINPLVLDRLIAFVAYSQIDFENIIKLKSNYSVNIYLILKILKDRNTRKNVNSVKLTIKEFKEKLGLYNKYSSVINLQEKVLEVIKREINDYTDLDFDYKLTKGESGKAKKYVELSFNYKPETLESKKTKKNSHINKHECILESNTLNEYIDESSPFEQTLVSWGIRARKVVEIEETYSLDVIQSAIELTLEKEKVGEIKTTKASIFLGILENKQQASNEMFEREQLQLYKQEEKDHLKALGAEYDAMQKVIDDNDDEISSYLSAKAMGATYEISPALNEQLINMSCVDAEKFKGFRPKLPVLHNGYFNINHDKKVFPNLYDFLILITHV